LEQAPLVMPDIVMMDVRMPRMTGYDACRAMKAEPASEGYSRRFPLRQRSGRRDPDGHGRGRGGIPAQTLRPRSIGGTCESHSYEIRKIIFLMSAILLDGSMVHYEALGRGRPVVFLHGWVGSWRYWINAMQAASTSFRAYALDLFGFGDTTRDPLRYSLDKQTDLLRRFLEEMGIGKVALVGHDLGALVSLSFIRNRPKAWTGSWQSTVR
jgi:hypothetical protein